MNQVEHLSRPSGDLGPRCGPHMGPDDRIVEAFTMDREYLRCAACVEIFEFRTSEKTSWVDYQKPEEGDEGAPSMRPFYCEGITSSSDGYWYEAEVFAETALQKHHQPGMTRAQVLAALPGYVWATRCVCGIFGSYTMARTAAVDAVENACSELHEGAFDSIDRVALNVLAERIIEWDREYAQGVRTYFRNDKLSVILGPSFWEPFLAERAFAPAPAEGGV